MKKTILMPKKAPGWMKAAFASACLISQTANAAKFGDWESGTTSEGNLYVASFNDSMSGLMKACLPRTGMCYWYLVTATRCEPGAEIPTLINSKIGSATISLVCDREVGTYAGAKQYRYLITNHDTMDKVAQTENPIGLAVALEGGRFNVYRFLTSGATRAISTLEEGTLRLFNKAKPGGDTRDSSL